MSKLDKKIEKSITPEKSLIDQEKLELDDEMEVILQEDALPVGPGY